MNAPSADAGIYVRYSPILERYVQVGIAGEKIIHLSFPTEPEANAGGDHPLLDRIGAYLEGAPDDFADVDVGLTVPTERRRVLEAVRGIPYGEEVVVEQVARMAGLNDAEEDDLASVREALAENPVPLFIPDHRVRDGPSAAPPQVEQTLRSVEEI